MNLISNAMRVVCGATLAWLSLTPTAFCAPTAPVAGPAASAAINDEIEQFRVSELQARLSTMSAGLEHDYLAGILANWSNNLPTSVLLLRHALPSLKRSNRKQASTALETLADDYKKSFRYAAAAQAGTELLAHYSDQLKQSDLRDTRDDTGLMRVLSSAPAQTIAMGGPIRLPIRRDAMSLLETRLIVGGVKANWILDTGANLSVVTRTFAARIGVTPLPGHSETSAGVTGIENPLQAGVVPTFRFGGATLRNVVVLILDDDSLKVGAGKRAFQINAIIGYPVLQALGRITISRDGELIAGQSALAESGGAPMYMRGLNPVLECGIGGELYPFTLDTGADSTDLSVRYFHEYHAESGGWKKLHSATFGAGGGVTQSVYVQPKLMLRVGRKTAVLHNIDIHPNLMHSDIDFLYGNLGQDLFASFTSYTFDFKSMSFSLGEPINTRPRN